MDGRKPKLLMDIHSMSEVNNSRSERDCQDRQQVKPLMAILTSVGQNVTDVKEGEGRNKAGTDSDKSEYAVKEVNNNNKSRVFESSSIELQNVQECEQQ